MDNKLKVGGIFTVKCFGPNGELKWEEKSKNLVVDEGLAHILDSIFTLGGVSPYANLYLGLTSGTPAVVAGDTMAVHGGWTEEAGYSEATRQEFIEARTSLTVDNSLSKAVYSINATATIGGAFVCSDNVKSATAGILIAASAFSGGDKITSSGDTVEVQYSFSASSV